MGPQTSVSILSDMKKPERTNTPSQPLRKQLPCANIKRAVCWQVVIVICQRQKTILLGLPSLMHHTQSPVPGSAKTAVDALTTWNFHMLVIIPSSGRERDSTVHAPIPLQPPGARHPITAASRRAWGVRGCSSSSPWHRSGRSACSPCVASCGGTPRSSPPGHLCPKPVLT